MSYETLSTREHIGLFCLGTWVFGFLRSIERQGYAKISAKTNNNKTNTYIVVRGLSGKKGEAIRTCS